MLKVQKLKPEAYLPTRTSPGAAGYDLYSAEDVVIKAESKAIVKTGISIGLPEGCYGRIAPRSGLAWKYHIDIGAGVIDRDYRGEVGVVMFNLSKTSYTVSKGDRVAQLVLERIITPPVVEVEALDETVRGAGGFGSSGLGAQTQKREPDTSSDEMRDRKDKLLSITKVKLVMSEQGDKRVRSHHKKKNNTNNGRSPADIPNCVECGLEFKHHTTYIAHMSFKHDDFTPYKCKACCKCYQHFTSLKRHRKLLCPNRPDKR